MVEVISVTEIDAKPSQVWKVLTDLDAFSQWNPFIRRARGSTEVGGTVHVRVRPSLPVPLAFSAKIVENSPGKSLRWYGKVLWRWIGAGDHLFALEPLAGGRTRLVQREQFSGILPRLARRLLARETQRGFDAMNRALADRAIMEGP